MKATAERLLEQLKERITSQLEEGIRLLTQYGQLVPYSYTDRETGELKTEMVAPGYCQVFKMGSPFDEGSTPEPMIHESWGWSRATNTTDLAMLARSADLLLQRARQANPRTRK